MNRHLVVLAITALLASYPQMQAKAVVSFSAGSNMQKPRFISKVAPVNVEVPVGMMPRLPWQVWVTYSDGTHEWRQVRWNNASVQDERNATDVSKHPVGSKYAVDGVIVGDNTTADGYPIIATADAASCRQGLLR